MQKALKALWHPATGFIGMVISIAIAIYFGLDAQKSPELYYYISPTRTAIVQKEALGSHEKVNLDNFTVSLGNEKITNDVSSAEIQIWNAGKKEITANDLLTTNLSVMTAHGEPIYMTSITSNRKVIHETAETESPGTLQVGWRILEMDDAIKIQIIYGGKR